MNREFHYWLTGLIAKEAGFSEEESRCIAYSSEYVDENDVRFDIKNRANGQRYSNLISQTMNIMKPAPKLMRIYPVFHFIPGEPTAETAIRTDGKMHLFNTTPNSPRANEMLDAAFKSSPELRLYRIGIATHAFVDTWAHQNFVGFNDSFNNIGLDLKPNIGHADAEHHPDYVSHRWVDTRLVNAEINNRERFLAAAETLFARYCAYLNQERQIDRTGHWPELEQTLAELMGSTYTGTKEKYKKRRLAAYKQAIPWLPEFDERQWFDAAVQTKVRGLRDSHSSLGQYTNIFKDDYYWLEQIDHTTSDWFKFQEAVREHQSGTLSLLSDLFKTIGIDLTRKETMPADF